MEREKNGTDTYIESISKKKRRLTRLRKIVKIIMFLCVLILLLCNSKLGQSFHKKQATQPAALPKRFFPAHSSVLDFPFGQLQPVINLLRDEELILVMYYAPWCAQSVAVREEFLRAAKVLSTTVKSVAVNCWYVEGECRKTLKFVSYPELFVYHTGVKDGYRFTGPKEAEHIVKFAESFLFPLQHINTERQMTDFIAQHDNTVIGYFDFNASPQPPGLPFHQFYLTALRVMSYEFYAPVRFGVVCKTVLAHLIDLMTPNRILMTRAGNTTIKYPLFYNLTCRNMTNWIFHHKQRSLAQWLVPPGVKSITLSLPIKSGPAVMVFGPVNPLLDFNPFFEMVHIASLAYNSCENNTDVFRHRARKIIEKTVIQLNQMRDLHLKCQETSSTTTNYAKKVPSNDSKCCISLASSSQVLGGFSVCEYCVQKPHRNRETVCDMGVEFDSGFGYVRMNSCHEISKFYNVNMLKSLSCQDQLSGATQKVYLDTSGRKFRRSTDPYVITAEKEHLRRQCSKLSLRKLKQLITLDELTKSITTYIDIKHEHFTGLSCRTNKTVGFYFLDSVYNSMFAERFGAPLPASKSSVILVDLQNEADYILKEKLNYKNLVSFVSSYTNGSLVRHQRSSDSVPDWFPAGGCDQPHSGACITEVTTSTFQSVVMDNTKDVVLLYYSTWCGFCSQFAHIYLTVAKYFSQRHKEIHFARVNGDTNDLPWEFQVDTYPSVLLFPANRKSESFSFPESIPKSVANVIKFLLHHTNKSLQLDTAVSMCSTACVKRNREKLMIRIKELEKVVAQLKRRKNSLWAQYNSKVKNSAAVQKVIQDVKNAITSREYQLRKAKMLNFFLKNGLDTLDKQTFLSFMR